MPNWAYTNYVIEGSKKDLQKIRNAIKEHPVREKSSDDWEGNVLDALNIQWDEDKLYMRGFICQDTVNLEESALYFDAEEAWGLTDFHVVLGSAFPDCNIFYSVEECGEGIYATNDVEGTYFPDRFYVNVCIDRHDQFEYFSTEKAMYQWLANLTGGKVKTEDDVERFNNQAEESGSDDFISINEFTIET